MKSACVISSMQKGSLFQTTARSHPLVYGPCACGLQIPHLSQADHRQDPRMLRHLPLRKAVCTQNVRLSDHTHETWREPPIRPPAYLKRTPPRSQLMPWLEFIKLCNYPPPPPPVTQAHGQSCKACPCCLIASKLTSKNDCCRRCGFDEVRPRAMH